MEKEFMSCPDDVDEEEELEKKSRKKKDIVDELFGDEDEEEEKKAKKCKPKDEFDELYEQGQGNPEEDIYATEDFERYNDGVAN